MPRLKTLAPLVKALDHRFVRPDRRKKRADPIYATAEFRQWRRLVVERAGFRCEAVDRFGQRCSVEHPSRLFADHIHELKDQGDPFDLANGQCLCSSHHVSKTNEAKAKRLKG